MPIRKNHGSISSTDSGHSEAMSYCDGNVYQLTSSILHNPPSAAPLPPRRHSAVQQGSNPTNLYHQQLLQPTPVNNSSTKQANGDISSMPPPPNPRTRIVPFPINVPSNVSAGFNVAYASQQQHLSQLRRAGKCIGGSFLTNLLMQRFFEQEFPRHHQDLEHAIIHNLTI